MEAEMLDDQDNIGSHESDSDYIDQNVRESSLSGQINQNKIKVQSRNSSQSLPYSLKWERHRPFYNDDYVDLYRSMVSPDDYEIHLEDSETIQIGAVSWDPQEQVSLFQAVARKGRHDLPELSTFIGSKSILEVKDYLDHLQQGFIDRQLFERYTRNVSHAEIPAAVEVGADVEGELEKAADALAAFQDQYDYAAGRHHHDGLPWLITQSEAADLDAHTDNLFDETASQDEPGNRPIVVDDNNPMLLFHLSRFLELSEKFFMNENTGSVHDHWHDLAEHEERPSMTADVVAELHDIVVNLVRRLIQSTIFLASSRIRATTADRQTSTCSITKEDVCSALKVLGIVDNLWDYWSAMPRRRGFTVVEGSHKKGRDEMRMLDYDEVEAVLSVHTGPRSRSRGWSISSSSSAIKHTDDFPDALERAGPEISKEGSGNTAARNSSPTNELLDLGADTNTENQDFGSELTDTSSDGSENIRNSMFMSRTKRLRMLEEEQDGFLENLDQIARKQEEARLLKILGGDDDQAVKEEVEELGRRPRSARKTIDEVKMWSGDYISEWERFGNLLNNNGLPVAVKRRKIRSEDASG